MKAFKDDIEQEQRTLEKDVPGENDTRDKIRGRLYQR